MRKKLLIIGTGHQSDLIKFDKFFTKQYQSANCIQLRNNSSILKQITENNIKNNDLIIAIGNNYLREKITKLLEKNLKKISWATYIAKSSNIKKKCFNLARIHDYGKRLYKLQYNYQRTCPYK